ncbi:hypothetical protein J19TS2_34530 [Cohnella xylanilytica]|uniref:GGDEF domain-containing protein n=1 Tax=Cohnella xylanilytica TaxID=557555 RepID=UPI001B26C497|nr:GGDEF domain-containing protein [Cohnella xylanilytica]GIO13898.1 hypothetical protein J19TS2_34530 [Cohnella xylanilytica]
MLDDQSSDYNQLRWNRLLLRGFWFVLILSIGVESVYFTMTDRPEYFVWAFIVRPSALILAIILLAEAGVRFLPKQHDYVLISASALIASVLTVSNPEEPYLIFTLFFPVMISIFYFKLTHLLFALLNGFVSLAAIFAFGEVNCASLTPGSFVGIVSILILFSIVAVGILLRGQELRLHLKSSYESNQELLLRTIMMDKLAKTDALTETYNHMAFHEYLERLVEQSESSGMPLQLAMLDIDNFKSVNEGYGHRAGDAVLRDVGSVVRSMVGVHDIVARYGGEELAVLFADMTAEEAYERMEEIRGTIHARPQPAIGGESVTVSAGVASYSPGQGKEAFFEKAEAALNEAKRHGKNRTVLAR